MTKISNVNSNVRNAEMNTLAQSILSAVYLIDLEKDEYLNSMVVDLENEQSALNDAIYAERVSSKLGLIAASMQNSFKNLHKLMSAYSKLPTSTTSVPASSVLTILNRHYEAILIRKTQADINSGVSSLLAELKEDFAVAQLNKLSNVSALISELDVEQAHFVDTFADYQNKKEIERRQQTATSIKQRMLKFINYRFVLHLNAMSMIQPSVYADFSTAVSAYIAEQNLRIKSRKITPNTKEDELVA